MRHRGCFALVTFVLLTSSVVVAQSSGSLNAMKLLAPEVGWTATESRLFWTKDGGKQWADITPPTDSAASIASVFFLDVSNGWVLLVSNNDDADEPVLDIAHTTSAGASWFITRVTIPNLNPRSTTLSGDGQLDFVDNLHGWMNLDVASSANFRLGVLLLTADGGKTWNLSPDGPGDAGSILFISPKVGWLAGGPGDERLYATRDGSYTWQDLLLQAPPEVSAATHRTYSLPVFEDDKNGFLAVTYSGLEEAKSVLVFFSTDDGGKSWTKYGTATSSSFFAGANVPFAVVNSRPITVEATNHNELTMTTLDQGKSTSKISRAELPTSALKLSFVSSGQGWLLAGGELIATSNGGASWVEITPRAAPHVSGSTLELNGSPFKKSRSASRRLNTGASLDLSEAIPEMGFHQCDAVGADTMQTWWDSSPYYAAGIYFGGVSRTCHNEELNHIWVTKVLDQGWDLMPFWVGEQAPCACRIVDDECVLFPHRFTLQNAARQGKTEADDAAQFADQLGLAGTVIYYDMEQYDSTADSGTCGKAVTKFLTSWSSELKIKGYSSGSYGSPADAQNDWHAKTVEIPQNIFIAKTPFKGSPPNISIFGLSPLCDIWSKHSCPLWSNRQRSHQYLREQTDIKWGGKTWPSTDLDIVYSPAVSAPDNATAVGSSEDGKTSASDCVKDCTFDYTSIDFPSAVETTAVGINDAGDIVGSFKNSSDMYHGFLFHDGAYTSIDYPGATQGTFPAGINNIGQIVGTYCVSDGCSDAFLYANGSYTSISLGNGPEVAGINDDGLIAGYYDDCKYGFVYDSNTKVTTTFQYNPSLAGGENTCVWGINGDALIVGDSGGGVSPPFLYNPVTGKFTALSFSSFIFGLNNNLQIIGGVGNDYFLFDFESGSETTITYPGATYTVSYSVNDDAQVVGVYSDGPVGAPGNSHGFLATPKQ